MSFLRNRLTRNIGLVVGLGAGMLGFSQGASAAPPVNMQGVIPMAADNPGKLGTNWHTTVWAEQDAVDQATLTLCASNNARPADASECHEYALNRGAVLAIDDAWQGFQAVPPGGFLWRVDGVTPDQVALSSRTYTPSPNGQPGTLGQGAPSLLIPNLPVVGTSQFVPGHMRDGFRTNVGLFNTTTQPSDVLVRIHTGGGNVVAEQTFALPGLGWQQLNDVFTTLGTPVIPNAYIEVVQLSGEKLAVYSSVIDNTSGDPTTFMAKTAYSGQHQLWIPAAAHLNGYNGTKWVTDVMYLNASNVNQSTGGLDFYPYNHDNSGGGSIGQSWDLGSGQMMTFQDVLMNLYGLDGVKGSLWQAPLDSHLIWARTFNNGGASGTFGQEYPSIFADTDKITGDLEGILVGLSQSTDPSTGYRSAIGLLNTGTSTATFHVDLYDDQGTLKGSLDQDVPPLSLFQIDKAYTKVTSDAVNNGRVNVKLTSGQGFAYASITDNVTGDPTTQYPTIRVPFVDPAVQYIQQWFPTDDTRFYLSNLEAKAMINGTPSTRSFAPDLAAEFWNDPRVQGAFPNVQAVEQWLRDRADGNPSNSEFCATFDPWQWTAGVGVRIYDGLSCGPVDFKPGTTPLLAVYTIVKTQFLPNFVRDNASLYGNLDLETPPSNPWNTQDPN